MQEHRVRDALASIFHWRGRTLALLCLIGFVVFRMFEPVPFESLRTSLFDTLQVLKPRDRPNLPVIIVDIDEDSLAKYGQWPWPRNRIAELVDKIAEKHPLAIGFDILFPEPDRSSPHLILEHHPDLPLSAKEHLANLPSHDTELAKSLARAPTVLGIGALLSDEHTLQTRPVKAIPVTERA